MGQPSGRLHAAGAVSSDFQERWYEDYDVVSGHFSAANGNDNGNSNSNGRVQSAPGHRERD